MTPGKLPVSETRVPYTLIDPTRVKRTIGIILLVLFSLAAGAASATVEPLLIIAAVGGLVVAALVANRPIWGLYLAMTVWFIRPGELFGVPFTAKLADGLVIAGFLTYKAITKEKWVRTPMNRWVLLLLAGGLISFLGVYWAYAYEQTLKYWLIQLTGYFLILNLTADRKSFMSVLKLFLLLVAVNSVMGIFSYVSYSGYGDYRASGVTGGIFESGNDFAQLLCMFMPVAVMMAQYTAKRFARLYYFGLALIYIAVLTMTGSRGGFVGLIVIGIMMAWYSKKRAIALALLPALTAVLFAASPGYFVERVESITSYGQDESAQGRIEIWKASFRMFLARPFTGVGLGCLESAAFDYGSTVDRVAHNSFLQILGELGLVGIVAFVGMIVYALLATHRAAVRLNARGDPLGAAAARGLFIGTWGYIVTAMFLTSCYYPDLYWLMALAAAIGVWSARDAETSGRAQ